ncbi:MAG: hypothetical protein CVU05_03735 [Bacteroidetes bacterium HGW-Bacteroidetes-21]|jgi:hypothetical protein|nr:MAG: hypothetical protein CVU05_03735 [Bacteroidetes bacterium HGW-Bacteroidetes-21]
MKKTTIFIVVLLLQWSSLIQNLSASSMKFIGLEVISTNMKFSEQRKCVVGYGFEYKEDGLLFFNDDTLKLDSGNIELAINQQIINDAGNVFSFDINFPGHQSIGWYVDSWNAQGKTMYISGGAGIKIFSGGQSRISLNQDGNVGIGTSNQFARLTVKGSNDQENILLIEPYLWQLGVKARLCIGDTNHFIQVENGLGLSFFDYNNKFIFKSANSEYVEFLVDGRIYARSVKVNLNSWSDHVFENDYSLMTLVELKTFINQNGHLPGVPDEKEVVDNGVDLGEMNKILLQKVEELTLYVIQLEEKVNNMEIKTK